MFKTSHLKQTSFTSSNPGNPDMATPRFAIRQLRDLDTRLLLLILSFTNINYLKSRGSLTTK